MVGCGFNTRVAGGVLKTGKGVPIVSLLGSQSFKVGFGGLRPPHDLPRFLRDN